MKELQADIVIVGGGTGGTAAAIQAARRGAKTIIVSEFPWLGGMLTSAGVSAPDGNELAAFQTGLWGAFLRELERRQIGGLDNGWVSFFTFEPRVGAEIFANWVKELPNLQWIARQVPVAVLREGDAIVGVRFPDFIVRAQVVLDGTELGDLLALGEVPFRWGWELQAEWNEPSAPCQPTEFTKTYPVQSPTWVVVMQDYGEGAVAPEIPAPPGDNPQQFVGAWEKYGPESFLNYCRLPGDRLTLNWPIAGNDYGEGVGRLVDSETARLQFLQEAQWHSQSFARFIQTEFGRRYGLAADMFPHSNSAFALHPYFRESRRLQGVKTVTEWDILPVSGGRVARLSVNAEGICDAVAFGNYANDHHYPCNDKFSTAFELEPKSIRWGGRWTGTPFTIPYGCLVPREVDGLLVCEKNISVSHIANGATRLQPVVMGIAQAAGMAAALCVERGCQPRDLPVPVLQAALLQDPVAPAAVVPLFNLTPDDPEWLEGQWEYLENPGAYPVTGDRPGSNRILPLPPRTKDSGPVTNDRFGGSLRRQGDGEYAIALSYPPEMASQVWTLVTVQPTVNQQLEKAVEGDCLTLRGGLNRSGNWIRVDWMECQTPK
ncbi:FAD-dependent oxidoreductase [Phormidium sp. CCY1219]|uniref:FAD-dependent oxidoreductase n=1 Tax=Phormidium sp. CCY1219 TaxID=2886104 RepID=UPI002D1F8FF5|nr:FAD-dependent oxidoreductase [Phormidium sp. CCY1219]MEB3830298.1 FAD-dependent oxidoreductase [Phormidium sp. CCY1219]